MRILLSGPSPWPESGGGYTFSQDIFQALTRAEGHQHQFYVMDAGQLPPILLKRFSKIQVRQGVFSRCLNWLFREAKRCIKRCIGLGVGHEAPFPDRPKG